MLQRACACRDDGGEMTMGWQCLPLERSLGPRGLGHKTGPQCEHGVSTLEARKERVGVHVRVHAS